MEFDDIKVLCTIFLVLLLADPFKAADVIETPQPVYGMQGSSVNLTCLVTGNVDSDPFEWREYISKPTGGERIFSDPETVPLDTNTYQIYGTYTLNIKSLDWKKNGGEYSCKVFSESSPHTAHVFVFQPHSMSAVRMVAGERSQLSCESRFGAMEKLLTDPGVTEPVMSMDIRGNLIPNAVYNLIPKTSSEPWILRGVANYTANKYDDGEDFGCTVTIQEPYAQIREVIKLDIQFQVEEPDFAPYNAMYYVGEYINCTARGNPDPSYEWRSIASSWSSQDVIQGSQLEISADMLGSTNQWECSATNIVNGNLFTASKTITFEVELNPDVPEPATGSKVEAWKIAVGICVPLAIIAIAVGVFFGIKFYKKKTRASDYKEKTPPSDVGTGGAVNPGAALPIEGDLANGKAPDVDAAHTPVSMQPNPQLPNNPINRSRDSPGYADLGVKQIAGSYPGVNVSMSSSMESFDDGEAINPNPNPVAPVKPPATTRPAPGLPAPIRYENLSYEPGPPHTGERPQNEDLKPNHPNTFV